MGVGLLLPFAVGPVGLNARGVIHILEGTCILYPVMYCIVLYFRVLALFFIYIRIK